MIQKILAFGFMLGMSINVWAACPDSMAGTGADEANACQVTTATELQAINTDATTLGLHYKLMNNIDLSGVTWTPIGASGAGERFLGRLDGDNKTISNLTIQNASVDEQGLFGAIGFGGRVQDLTLSNPSVTGKDFVGALAGVVYNDAWVVNVDISNPRVTGNHDVGGAVGHNYGHLNESSVTCTAACSDEAGPKIVGVDGVGGLSGGGHSEGEVYESFTDIRVYGNKDVGGLVGFIDGLSVYFSYANGDVFGVDDEEVSPLNIGGLVGQITMGKQIRNSYATGDVNASGTNVGGLVGQANMSATVYRSYATGSVTSDKDYIGGLVGLLNSNSTIQESYATGNVSGNSYVGGLTGRNNASNVNNSYSSGLVSGGVNSAIVGGLVGQNTDSSILNSYATGGVTGEFSIGGGLVGSSTGTGSVTTSYFDKTTNPSMSDEDTYGKTTAELKSFSTFETPWDIVADTNAPAGYPKLAYFEDISTHVWVIGLSENSTTEHTIGNVTATSELEGTQTVTDSGDVTTSITIDDIDISVVAKETGEVKATHSLKVGSKETKAESELSNTKTTIKADKSVETSAILSENGSEIKVVAKPDGGASHEVKLSDERVSQATSDIKGAQTYITQEGDVQTSVEAESYVDANGCSVKAVILTDKDGESRSEFVKECSGAEAKQKTVSESTPFEAGNDIRVYEDAEDNNRLKLKIETPVSKPLQF